MDVEQKKEKKGLLSHLRQIDQTFRDICREKAAAHFGAAIDWKSCHHHHEHSYKWLLIS